MDIAFFLDDSIRPGGMPLPRPFLRKMVHGMIILIFTSITPLKKLTKSLLETDGCIFNKNGNL